MANWGRSAGEGAGWTLLSIRRGLSFRMYLERPAAPSLLNSPSTSLVLFPPSPCLSPSHNPPPPSVAHTRYVFLSLFFCITTRLLPATHSPTSPCPARFSTIPDEIFYDAPSSIIRCSRSGCFFFFAESQSQSQCVLGCGQRMLGVVVMVQWMLSWPTAHRGCVILKCRACHIV